MLRRSVKIQLILFVLITLAGVSYVGANYVGIVPSFLGPKGCTVAADFPDSGGIFTNAEVTYRGVTVGKVGSLHLIAKGVRVDLKIDDCSGAKIPQSASATVADKSVIGEQYVDLVPPNDNGPYLTGGQVIPMSRNAIPTAPETLLTNLDTLVNSVNTTNLATVVDELGQAFNDRGQDLGTLLDATRSLLAEADRQDNLDATIGLIDNSKTVLDTQLAPAQVDSLKTFSTQLDLLSAQLKKSDPDIRTLFTQTPNDLTVVKNFLQANRTDIGVVLANLVSTNNMVVRHLDGVEEILELYPALAAGAQSVARDNGIAALGFVINYNDPPDCGGTTGGAQGYGGTKLRSPQDLSPQAPNTGAQCTLGPGSVTQVRGAANVPGGDPISTGGGDIVLPRASTKNTTDSDTTIRIGDQGTAASLMGDNAWQAMLETALH